jgi:methylated-DNA-[protein]-cysteine S-methyltransferase
MMVQACALGVKNLSCGIENFLQAGGENSGLLLFEEFDSPVGRLVLGASQGLLVALEFAEFGQPNLQYWSSQLRAVEAKDPFGFTSAINEYFAGDSRSMDQIPVHLKGTEFQKKVWLSLRTIPSGATMSYAQLAKLVGSPKACRAVGITNGRNPIAIVLPCHRVIGADGTLTGYGGGLPRKEWLLRHEGAFF